MTPENKAKDLVGKMCGDDCTETNIKRIIPIALIAIDEIISICPYQNYEETLCLYDGAELSVDYWEEVKQEIELL